MAQRILSALLAVSLPAESAAQASSSLKSYTVPASFPTGVFSKYYYGPSPSRQPQPKIYDGVLDYTFPLNLTDPTTIPEVTEDPVFYPPTIGHYDNGTAIIDFARSQFVRVLSTSESNCDKCHTALNLAKYVAQRVPDCLPSLLVELCKAYKFASNISCEQNYAATSFGAIWTQVAGLGDMLGLDGQYVCNSLSPKFCPEPFTLPYNISSYFGSKPKDVKVPKPSGNRVLVASLSDAHLDPRFATGQEASCSSNMCCRFPTKGNNFTSITVKAPTYGSFKCDSPYYLLTAALVSIDILSQVTLDHKNSSLTDHFAWTIYTGDLVSHDPQSQVSRGYVEYTEYSVYHLFKKLIPGGPVFAALGNHDTNVAAIDTPHKFPGHLGQQQSWNYRHVAGLWRQNGWISEGAASQARMHYGAYSINHPKYPKLRIITINTDFWYNGNSLNFINTTNPDNSGMLKFVVDELLDAECKQERVWIIGHVLPGWDGGDGMANPTDLFYQIVDRFSPHVIANLFFGHSHEDHVMIYYANNGTLQDARHARAVGWITPSITPLTNLNSGFRTYEVDTGDFSIYNAHTYISDVSTFADLDAERTGPVFRHEYSTREAYPVTVGDDGTGGPWPAGAPLNATYWHRVTEAMARNRSLVQLQNTYQGKSSVLTPNCSSDACAAARICYMRSASHALGRACPQGFASVQSKFSGKNY